MIRGASRIDHIEEYYFSKKLAEVRKLDSSEYPVLNLGIGNPDMMPDTGVIEELSATAAKSGTHGYQSYRGVPELRNAIARFYKKQYGVLLQPDDMILPLMGSKEGILHIALAFLNEGDEVLIPNPAYPTYASVTQLVGAKVIPYNLVEDQDWEIDWHQLESLDFSTIKMMFINYPHMPTGKQASKEVLTKLVALARKHQFLIVNDNPYSLVLNDQPTSLLSIDGAEDVALELNSLSKSHNMAGWRLGWVVGKKEYVDLVLKVRSNMDSGMFLPMQLAAAKALDLGDEWFDQLNASYMERKAIVHKILDELDCSYSEKQTGLFIWAKVSSHVRDVEKWIDEILYSTKVFITPGFIFGDNGKRFIRISLCNPADTLLLALDRIRAFQSSTTPNTLTAENLNQ